MGPKPEIFNVLLAVLMSKPLKIIKQNPIIDVINIINLYKNFLLFVFVIFFLFIIWEAPRNSVCFYSKVQFLVRSWFPGLGILLAFAVLLSTMFDTSNEDIILYCPKNI